MRCIERPYKCAIRRLDRLFLSELNKGRTRYALTSWRLTIMKKMQGILFAAFLLMVFSIPVWAHHSFSSEFDANKKVSIDGVISKVELINPHGYVHVDVKDPKTGKVTTWLFETHGPGQLRRMGLTRDVVGQHAVVDGYAARDGSSSARGTKYVFDDGRTILTYSPEAK